MIWFYYMLADYLIFEVSPEVVAIAEQLVKVSANSFCNAIYNATFSNTSKGRKLLVKSKYTAQENQNK